MNATIVLLHTKGARTGREHVIPLVALPLEGGRYAIFASHGGSPRHPDWYHNLRANPRVTCEVGTRVVHATARVTKGEERERIWARQKANRPYFADYERRTTREIPVIVLEGETEAPTPMQGPDSIDRR